MDARARVPVLVGFAKLLGPSAAIFGAALVWPLNDLISRLSWWFSRRLRTLELSRAVIAEISNNRAFEETYSSAEKAEAIISALKTKIDDEAPLAPYIAVYGENFAASNLKTSFDILPRSAIGAVVRDYNTSGLLSAQIADFRSEAFLALSRSRQETVIRNLDTVVGAPLVPDSEAALTALSNAQGNLEALFTFSIAFVAIATFLLVAWAGVMASSFIATVTQAAEWESSCSSPGYSKDVQSEYRVLGTS